MSGLRPLASGDCGGCDVFARGTEVAGDGADEAGDLVPGAAGLGVAVGAFFAVVFLGVGIVFAAGVFLITAFLGAGFVVVPIATAPFFGVAFFVTAFLGVAFLDGVFFSSAIVTLSSYWIRYPGSGRNSVPGTTGVDASHPRTPYGCAVYCCTLGPIRPPICP